LIRPPVLDMMLWISGPPASYGTQDWNKYQRKNLLKYAKDRGIRFSAVDTCTNFTRTGHILVPRYEKETAYLRKCCELAQDMECPVVRILPVDFTGPSAGNQLYPGSL
jgi:sugar phosphate isomerase/epimerase